MKINSAGTFPTINIAEALTYDIMSTTITFNRPDAGWDFRTGYPARMFVYQRTLKKKRERLSHTWRSGRDNIIVNFYVATYEKTIGLAILLFKYRNGYCCFC